MKKLLIILFVFFTINANAQTSGKWSVGVGYTPSIEGGLLFTAYGNRHLSDKWQIGLMPFGWFNSESGYYNSSKSITTGLNISTRYFPFAHKVLSLYIYSYTGYAYSQSKYESISIDNITIKGSLFDISLGLGLEAVLFKSDWSIDANVGYLSVKSFRKGRNSSDFYTMPMFSVGILKRFGK